VPGEGNGRVADRWLGPAEVAAATSVVDSVRRDRGVRLAFVSGSLAAGLGHALSDVDLYVLCDEAAGSTRSVRQDGFVVQVNSLSEQQFETARRACSSYGITAGDRWQAELEDRTLSLTVRLAIGTVLRQRDVELPEAAVRRQVVRQVLITRAAIDVSSLAEDVLGARDIGDLLTELVAARRAVETALEAALAAADDLYVSEKFLMRRLARTPATAELLPECWELLQDPGWPPDPQRARALVDRRLALATYLVGRAALDGWQEPLHTLPPRPQPVADGGPTRSRWFCPIRFGQLWGLAGPDAGYRITEGVVRIWLALDGRPPERAFERLRTELPEFGTVQREAFQAGVDGLLAIGAAVPAAGPAEREDG
jgi:hypothetical protein